MKVIDIIKINNALSGIDKSQITDDAISTSLVWNMILFSDIVASTERKEKTALEQFRIKDSDKDDEKKIKQDNLAKALDRIHDEDVTVDIEKVELKKFNEAIKKVSGFKLGFYTMLRPIFILDKEVETSVKKSKK